MNRPRCTISVMRGLITLVRHAWDEINATRTRSELLDEHGRTGVRDMERAAQWVGAMQQYYEVIGMDKVLKRKD